MAIPQSTIDQVIARTDISDVVGRYVPLRKSGVNYKALCPFHKEKTPSFMVNPQKQIYHCFGCGAGGNAISFLMSIEGLSFKEAVMSLAESAGVALEFEGQKEQDDSRTRKVSLKQLLSDAQDYFTGSRRKYVFDYCRERGIGQETAEQFGIGYAADTWEGLREFLLRKKRDIDAAEQVGLVIKGERGYYDRFRGRITIPIRDVAGDIVGFGGRGLEADAQPKYLNTPETVIFHKGRTLFNLFHAKSHIRMEDSILIAEGYFDVISLCAAGINNVVGTMGTSLTEDHARLILRYTKTAYVSFDGDNAGRQSALRACAVLAQAGLSIKVIVYPDGMDPDDFIRVHGREAFDQLKKEAKDFWLFGLDLYKKNSNPIIDVSENILPIVSGISNHMIRSKAVRDIANVLGIREDAVWQQMRRRPAHIKETDKDKPKGVKIPCDPAEMLFLALLMDSPDLVRRNRAAIDLSLLCSDHIREIAQEILNAYDLEQKIDAGVLCNKFSNSEKIYLITQVSFDRINSYANDETFLDVLVTLKRRYQQRTIEGLLQRVREYESSGKDTQELLRRVQDIKRQMIGERRING